MLILASSSPRRQELLSQAGFLFTVQASSILETRTPGEHPISLAIRLAREKAEAVFAGIHNPHEDSEPLLILGADTIVICDEEVFGKPADTADAERMLSLLSGRTHQVVTGVALVSGPVPLVEVAAEMTHVTMRTLSAREISDYAATGEPMDKAGAYAIQGHAGRWISRIGGCYFNVVGLPLALVASLLEGAHARWLKRARSANPTLSYGSFPDTV